MDVQTLAYELRTLAQRLDTHIRGCDESTKESIKVMVTLTDSVAHMGKELTEVCKTVAGYQAMPGQALKWIVGVVMTAAIGLGAENLVLHKDATDKAQIAATQASNAAAAVQRIPSETATAVVAKVKASTDH